MEKIDEYLLDIKGKNVPKFKTTKIKTIQFQEFIEMQQKGNQRGK